MKTDIKSRAHPIERLATGASSIAGSTNAIIIAFAVVLLWGICGPVFHYSETWQMVINTSTGVITFLIVFLIQKSQNKDSLAIQLKLNELVAAHENASNRLVAVESMTEEELKVIQKYYGKLSELARSEDNLRQSISIEEAKLQEDLTQELNDNAG